MTYTKNADRMMDDTLVLMDTTAAITADALATVDGTAAAGIVDLGLAPCAFDVVFDIAALSVANSDEEYRMQIVGSNSATFASGIALLGELRLGAFEALTGATAAGDVDVDSVIGTYILTCRNYSANGTVYRYVRLCYEEETGTNPSWTPAGPVFIASVRPA
jgi:hypothetical protein